MRRIAAFLVLTLAAAACGHQESAVPVATAPSALMPPHNAVAAIAGFVLDTGFRPVAGATVEVADGPQARTSTITDAAGQFSLTGTFDETTRFHATRDGYVAATQTWSCSVGTCPGVQNAKPWLGFYLATLAAPVDLAGDYTLTFIADSACADLPDEVRTRTYAATITPEFKPNVPASTSFNVAVSGPPLFKSYDGFTIGVAGDYLGFWLYGGHNAAIAEQVAANTYLAYSGTAAASLGTSAVSTISTPFNGWIEYCVQASAMGPGPDCPVNATAHTLCESSNHRLILTRR